MTFRIESMTLYSQIGVDDEEGIIGFLTPEGTWMPMVCADHVRLAQLRGMAQTVADTTRRPVRVLRFETVVEVETLEPT